MEHGGMDTGTHTDADKSQAVRDKARSDKDDDSNDNADS